MNYQVIYQKKFFDYLLKRRGVETILYKGMEVLHIQKGAMYKRMNGETALTTAELIQLANHFDVSLDTIFQSEKYVTIQHPFLDQVSTIDFLDKFTFFLKPLQSNYKSDLTYLANELPVFYYFSHKYIFNFLLSIWNHLHWSDTKLEIEENKEVNVQIEKIRAEITQYYEGHPVTEIWNSNMFANLYQQVIFCVTIRAFKDVNYILKLLEDIKMLIEHLHELAFKGVMEGQSSERKIYLNDFGNYLNVVLYQSEKINSTFIGYDIPHFLVSYNSDFFEFSKKWIKRIKRRSVLISAEGYQYRELFFIKMENDFKDFDDKIAKLIGVYYS